MYKPCAPGDDGIFLKDRIQKDQFRIHHIIAQSDLQSLRFPVIFCVCGRQREKGGLSLRDPVADISKIRDPAAVLLQYGHSRTPVIACSVGRIFLFGVVHR